MSNEQKTMIRVTEDELNKLAEASDIMYGVERQVPRGAVVRRLAENYIEEVEE